MTRYGKRPDMVVHEEEPFNAETGAAALAEGPVTATEAFYVRGHGAVPEIGPEGYPRTPGRGAVGAWCYWYRDVERRRARRGARARWPGARGRTRGLRG